MNRIRLIKLAIASLPLVTILSSYTTSGWQWPEGVTVTYRIHQGVYSDWSDAIESAFETWENVSTANIGFLRLGDTPNLPQILNSECEIGFIDEGWANYSSDPQLVAASITYEEYGVTKEVDLVFNDQYHNWSTNGAYQTFDVEHVAAHEAGHWVGLDHSSNSLTTMHPDMFWYDTYKRDLHSDDIAGASFLYPYDATWPQTLTPVHTDLEHTYFVDVALAWNPEEAEECFHLACQEGYQFEGLGDTVIPFDAPVSPVRVVYGKQTTTGWAKSDILSNYHQRIYGPQLEISNNIVRI